MTEEDDPSRVAPRGASEFEPPDDQDNLWWTATLLRLLTLRRTGAPRDAGVGVLLVLACLACGAWIGVDWFRNQPDPAFYPYGISGFAWYALMAMAIAAVLARLSRPALQLPRVLTVVLAATPVLIVARDLIDRSLSWRWAIVASLGLLVYLIGYGARALSALSGVRQPRALVSGIVVMLGLLWVTDWLYVDPSVWMTREDEAEASNENVGTEAEELLFSQAARIDAAVDAIEPARDGSPAVFFLGFAGYAEQRVFAEEIQLAARVVGKRYGSGKRSIFLINDRRSLDAHPLASLTGLRHALRRLARKMDAERDVLFLALSSHGEVDTLSVSNRSLMLQDLVATDLAAALQESGIKWRVIVISACHAGSFIDELRNANTIVITASAAEKTSFGCSDERELTYFGEAFYRDALPGAKSLRDAFETAKADIAEREKREDIEEASDPQAFFGEAIERHLTTLPPVWTHYP
jgi:hypothetical protein